MGLSITLAARYMRSRKRESISVGTLLAICGVALGTMALVTVLGVTGGFRAEFREKVLGVNAHVLVLKYSSEFREYREVMEKVEKDPDVVGAAPFVINPMMVTHADKTATGVLLKGVDPERMQRVLDLPRHIVTGTLEGLRRPGAKPPERKKSIESYVQSSEPGARDQPEVDLLGVVRNELEAHDSKSAQKSVGAQAAEQADGPGSQAEPHRVNGSIEPAGGFEGDLPEDDVLEGIVTDPCAAGGEGLPGIVIGTSLQRTLGVKLGDCVQVTSPTIGYAYSGGQLRPPVAKQFRVQGTFEAGFDQYDSRLMYTDLYEAQAFYGAGDTVTGIEMRVRDIERSQEVTERIDKLLSNGIYHTMDWEELNHGLFTALRIQQILMSLVLALIILVAAFTVIATLIMIVFDKTREIAVLKSMGAKDSALLRTFLYQGLVIGVVGAGLGLLIGFLLCKWVLAYGLPLDPKVYFISRLPVIIRPADFALTGLFAVLVCLGACLWPAMHAARLRPADAFREQ